MRDNIALGLKDTIRLALQEDLGLVGDITTQAIIRDRKNTTAEIKAKSAGTLAGAAVAEIVFRTVDKRIMTTHQVSDGTTFSPGDVIMEVMGPAGALITAERTALNFLIFMSGIATRTRQFSDELRGSNVKVADTRKTIPGTRSISKLAVLAGGGVNHRLGLYDMYLAKDNHVLHAGSVTEALIRIFDGRKGRNGRQKIEIEVIDLPQLEEALRFPVDVIMLDNMTDANIKKASKCIRMVSAKTKRDILIEVSGNIDLFRIRKLKKIDIDLVSTSMLTMQPVSIDLSMEIKE